MAVRPALNVLSLCAGGGGLDLGVELAIPGARSVCMVEREAPAVARLVALMEAGLLHPAPVWSDARTFAGRPWRGVVDLLIGGCPCQGESRAGKRLGAADPRWLWPTFRRIIVQARPRVLFLENVGAHLTASFGIVRRELERLGFTLEVGLFTAEEVGAPHLRERLFILAVAHGVGGDLGGGARSFDGGWRDPADDCQRLADATCLDGSLYPGSGEGGRGASDPGRTGDHAVADADLPRSSFDPCGLGYHGEELAALERVRRHLVDASGVGWGERRPVAELRSGRDAATVAGRRPLFPPPPGRSDIWQACLDAEPGLEPSLCRMADGMADRVDRLRLLGNGVLPLAAGYALRTLAHRLAARNSGAGHLVRLMDLAA